MGVNHQDKSSSVADDVSAAMLEADGLGGGCALSPQRLEGRVLHEVADSRLRRCGRRHDPARCVRANYVSRAEMVAIHVIDDRLQCLDRIERGLRLSIMHGNNGVRLYTRIEITILRVPVYHVRSY